MRIKDFEGEVTDLLTINGGYYFFYYLDHIKIENSTLTIYIEKRTIKMCSQFFRDFRIVFDKIIEKKGTCIIEFSAKINKECGDFSSEINELIYNIIG